MPTTPRSGRGLRLPFAVAALLLLLPTASPAAGRLTLDADEQRALVNESVTFKVRATLPRTKASYRVTWGDGKSRSGRGIPRTLRHAYAKAGRFRMQLRITRAGRSTTARKVVRVTAVASGASGGPAAIGPAGPAGVPGAPGAPGAPGPAAPPRADVPLRLLGINDFHGNIEPPSGSSGRVQVAPGSCPGAPCVDAGGASYLATHVKRLREGVANTAFVGAGDMIGASPLPSGIYHDEPTIEALDAMGLEWTSVGNREFDEGPGELTRMQYGPCHPTEGCFPTAGDPFAGAAFDYLAANVRVKDTSSTLLPPYRIKRYGGIPVAFIGMTLEGTPDIITPSLGNQNLSFDDEAATANRLVRALRDEQGVRAFVILLHEGATPGPTNGFIDSQSCGGIGAGQPVVDIANRLDDDVDIIVSGHTHQPYICPDVDGKLVTSAFSFGRVITKIDVTLDGPTGDVEAALPQNVIVTRDVPQDPAVKAIVDKYVTASSAPASRVIGRLAAPGSITRSSIDSAGESRLGQVIADAQLGAAPANADGAPVVAFMNPGGIRSDLVDAVSGTNPPEGPQEITYGEAFTVQPFSNDVVTKSCTGAQLDAILEQQFTAAGANRIILQVSKGFAYTYSASAPAGSKVDLASITINGVPVGAATTYAVTMNSFLAAGGDGFPGFTSCTNGVVGGNDLQALESYLQSKEPTGLAVPTDTRITRVP